MSFLNVALDNQQICCWNKASTLKISTVVFGVNCFGLQLPVAGILFTIIVQSSSLPYCLINLPWVVLQKMKSPALFHTFRLLSLTVFHGTEIRTQGFACTAAPHEVLCFICFLASQLSVSRLLSILLSFPVVVLSVDFNVHVITSQ